VPGAGRRLWAPLSLKHVERQSYAFRQLMTPWRFATERPVPKRESRVSGAPAAVTERRPRRDQGPSCAID